MDWQIRFYLLNYNKLGRHSERLKVKIMLQFLSLIIVLVLFYLLVWRPVSKRMRTNNISFLQSTPVAVFIGLGVILVVIGIALDNHNMWRSLNSEDREVAESVAIALQGLGGILFMVGLLKDVMTKKA